MPVYVEGQLSNLKEKSCEPIALRAGVPPRTLQEFLAQHKWEEDRARQRLQEIVLRDHAGPHPIGIIDETSDVKKGTKTPGVQRQWCGTVGKKENCIVTVHLAYATGDFHCLLDGELFLPESWSQDRARCREAGIPNDMVYRPKWKIALELYDRACANGFWFEWLTVDEGYGGKPGFLQALAERRQPFVAEVPVTFSAWLTPPRVTERPYRRGRGRPRKSPRVVSGSRPPISVKSMLLYSPELRNQPWIRYRVKDGEKGPLVWDVKHTMITMKNDDDLPGHRLHLLVARNVLDPSEVKFFVANAPEDTSVQTLLLVAFSRWRVERCFQDQKQEVGLDEWEGRRYLGLKRHLILSSISYLFLAQVRERYRGKKSRNNRSPDPYGCRDVDAVLVA
jgi:SRSO17 transposase